MELKALSELVSMAEWAAYNRFNDVLRNVIVILQERGMKFDDDSVLQRRLSFVGYDRLNTPGDDMDLDRSLTILQHLYDTYADSCTSLETSKYQWLRIRQKTLVQKCIVKLQDQLGMDITDVPPEDPRQINLPADFSLQSFRLHVEEILHGNKIYNSNVMFGKIEDELIRNSYAMLVDTFPEGKISKEKVKLGLHYLLHQFPFKEYSNAVSSFARKVESQALTPPTVSPSAADSYAQLLSSPLITTTAHTSAMSSDVPNQEVDWSEDTSAAQGPYASPKKTPVPAKTTSSSKKTPKKTRKSTPVKNSAEVNEKRRRIEEDGEDTEEQRHIEPLSKRTRSKGKMTEEEVNNVTDTLRQTRENFQLMNQEKDPLLDALSHSSIENKKSSSRVQSVVGSRTTNKLPKNDSIENSSSDEEDQGGVGGGKGRLSRRTRQNNRSKKSIDSARGNSTKVVFTESSEEDESDYHGMARRRAQLEANSEVLNLKSTEYNIINAFKRTKGFEKFPKKLEVTISHSKKQNFVEHHTNQSRTKWAPDEVDALLDGVQRYGTSAWAIIRDDPLLKHRFNNRTNMNLKDKYRNLQRKGVVDN